MDRGKKENVLRRKKKRITASANEIGGSKGDKRKDEI
jgi:hypothetical protein